MRGRILLTILATALVFSPAGAAGDSSSISGSEAGATGLRNFLDGWFREYVGSCPELSTSLGDLSPLGVPARQAEWDERSDDFRRRESLADRGRLAYLNALDPASLTPDLQAPVAALRWYLDNQTRGERFLYHAYLLDPGLGVQTQIPSLLTGSHPLRTRQDAEDYIARLKRVGRLLAQVGQAIETRAGKGFLPPAYIVETVGEQCREFTLAPASDNVLCTYFVARLAEIPELSPAERAHLAADAEKAVYRTVYPAYRRMAKLCERLRPKATLQAGVWQLPDGEAYYRHILRSRTSTDLTPEEIHQLGLAEVARITAEMRVCLTELGIAAEGRSLPEALRLVSSPRLYDRESIFAQYRSLLDVMQGRLPELFGLLPRSPVGLEAVPAIRERTISNYYELPALDGSRPGVFYANLSLPSEERHMHPLLYHETIPGHHLQLSLQQELETIPLIQKVLAFDAYVEGWALYAERLALEQGFYGTPALRLAYLQSELLRAARLVIDTGLHYKRWSREEAVNYLAQVTGQWRPAEIDRYIVMPGQACAYKIGELKFLELREKARTALGERFDLRGFHDAVLRNGSLPLPALEHEVDRYIADLQAP